ncbi:MAG: hypothetical protein U9Q19_02645 [Pseudomonadota bacterium]|nr:hypothetical protein [Pseudomonadota bacterium]
MGEKATFDPVTRIIQITSAPVLIGGELVVELDVKEELYSDQKVDWAASETLRRHKPPIEVVGGTPLPGSKKLGSTFFLASDWKIRPYEGDHIFRVNGNLFSVDGTSPFTQTTGSYNVFLEQSVSSLVDSTVQQLSEIEQASFGGGITVDLANGYSGADYPVGTRRMPSGNWADAHTILAARGLDAFFILGNALVDDPLADYQGHSFYGESPSKSTITIDPAANVAGCEFYDASILGTLDGNAKLYDCHLSTLNYVNGEVERCTLNAGTIFLAGGAKASLTDCRSGVEGWDAPVIDMGGAGQALVMRNHHGGVKLTNKTGTEAASLDINSGQVIVESSVSNGTVVLRGIGKVTDNSTGTAVIDQEYMLSPWSIAFYGKLLTVAKFFGIK